MGALTTHILDTSAGKPGNGIRIDLYRIDGERKLLITNVSNEDGRCDQPLLREEAFVNGVYEIIFHAGEYFSRQSAAGANPPFLDEVVISFGVADATQHYHVPLLISPYGYSTYKGS